jgi:hypothetical protein
MTKLVDRTESCTYMANCLCWQHFAQSAAAVLVTHSLVACPITLLLPQLKCFLLESSDLFRMLTYVITFYCGLEDVRYICQLYCSSSSSMALTAHIGPRPPPTRFLNLTLIDSW